MIPISTPQIHETRTHLHKYVLIEENSQTVLLVFFIQKKIRVQIVDASVCNQKSLKLADMT